MTPTRGLRTLPLRTEPVPGESLHSVLETAGRWYGLSAPDLAAYVGLPRRVDRLTVHADPQQVTDLAFVLGLDPRQVRGTTWSQGTRATSDADDRHVPGTQAGPAGAFCPRCLLDNGGRWLLDWRLPHAAVCRRHELRLVTTCPGCRRPPRGRESDHALTGAGCCPCGTSLVTATTDIVQRGTPADAGQVYARTLLTAHQAGRPVKSAGGPSADPSAVLTDLHWLADRAYGQLHPHDLTDATLRLDWTPDPSCGATPPVRPSSDLPARQHSVGLAAAVLGARGAAAAAEALRWLVIRERQQVGGPRTDWEHRREWDGVSPGLRAALDAVLAGDPAPRHAPPCSRAAAAWYRRLHVA